MATRDKAPDAFRTIGELSAELGVAQHILRYWESKFPQLRPLQRAGNRRYYRPADVALVRRIHGLLNNQGYTVRGVQQLLEAKVNDGAVQRSKVDHLTITFSAAVTLPPTPASAFTLIGPSGAVAVNVTQSAGNSVATLATGNLPDGKYTLTIIAAQVTDAFGQSLASNFALNFHRFFGDSDGDGTVAANDFIQFRLALGGNNPIFDFDGDGSVAASDFIQFRLRFGGSI